MQKQALIKFHYHVYNSTLQLQNSLSRNLKINMNLEFNKQKQNTIKHNKIINF